MSILVVDWEDLKGNEYRATNLYDPETGDFYDWNGTEFAKRPKKQTDETK